MFICGLVTDNTDLAVQARHQSSSHKNKSLHWTHTFAVKNRVEVDGDLDREVPQKKVEDLEMSEILPGPEIQESLKGSLVPLVLRVLVRHFPAYRKFRSAVEHHLPHQYSVEMRNKSGQVRVYIDVFVNPIKNYVQLYISGLKC